MTVTNWLPGSHAALAVSGDGTAGRAAHRSWMLRTRCYEETEEKQKGCEGEALGGRGAVAGGVGGCKQHPSINLISRTPARPAELTDGTGGGFESGRKCGRGLVWEA